MKVARTEHGEAAKPVALLLVTHSQDVFSDLAARRLETKSAPTLVSSDVPSPAEMSPPRSVAVRGLAKMLSLRRDESMVSTILASTRGSGSPVWDTHPLAISSPLYVEDPSPCPLSSCTLSTDSTTPISRLVAVAAYRGQLEFYWIGRASIITNGKSNKMSGLGKSHKMQAWGRHECKTSNNLSYFAVDGRTREYIEK